MDPLTHCLLGAVTSQAFFARRLGRLAPIVGGVAGILADADLLIQLPNHPLLAMDLHQQFTHALWFIPMGGLLAMLPFYWLKQLRYRRRALLAATTTIYAVHVLFDVISTQGTAIFWPVSNYRIAMDWLPEFDPLLLLILLAAVLIGLVQLERDTFRRIIARFSKPKRASADTASTADLPTAPAVLDPPPSARVRPTLTGSDIARYSTVGKAAFIATLFYAGIGAAQHQRAVAVQEQLADTRLHTITRSRVIPTQNNLIIWRSLYTMGQQIHHDALRLPLTGAPPAYCPGDSARALVITHLPKSLRKSPQAEQATQFSNRTDGWVAFVPRANGVKSPLADLRYTASPHGQDAYMGIRFDPRKADSPVKVITLTPADPTPWADRWQDLISPSAAAPPKPAPAHKRATRRTPRRTPVAPSSAPPDNANAPQTGRVYFLIPPMPDDF